MPLMSVKKLYRKYTIIPIITEDMKIFNISKLNFLEKRSIIESLDLIINKKRLIHEERDVDNANPTTPYWGNKNKANIMLNPIANKL